MGGEAEGRRCVGRAAAARIVTFPGAAEMPRHVSPTRPYHEVMDPNNLTLSSFQRHISERYEVTDRARGTPGTWMWFTEEVGELARALARNKDRANIEEEFADVLAWLCTLANINDVDLAAAVAHKYLGEKPPQGVKGL